MPAIVRKKVYAPLNGGLNDTLSPVLLGDTEAAELVNCRISDRAVLEKAAGYLKDHAVFPNDADSPIRMMASFRRGTSINDLIMAGRDDGNTNATYKTDLKRTNGDGTSEYINHTTGTNASFTNADTAVTGVGTSWSSHLKAGDKIKAASHADSAYTEISSVNSDTSITLVGGGYLGATAATVAYEARIILNKDNVPNGVTFNDKFIIVNGSEKPMTWDGSSLNKITDADCPTAKFVASHKNRLFMAGTSSAPSKIFWSAVNNEASWDAAANEDIYPQDNGIIVCIKPFGDSLIVFKSSGNIYQVIGNFDQDDIGESDYIRKVDTPENMGIIAPKSPVVHDGFLYFLAETGLYAIDPRMKVEKATRNVDNFLDRISFNAVPSASRSFSLVEQGDYDTGTYTGTAFRSGKLTTFFDEYDISDAYQGENLCAVFTDSSNVTHVAYVASNLAALKYVKFAVDGTATTETAVTADMTGTYYVSIAVSPSGLVGVSWSTGVGFKFAERSVGGTWGSVQTPLAGTTVYSFGSLAYTAGNEPRLGGIYATGVANNCAVIYAYYSGSWTVNTFDGRNSTPADLRCSLIINGSGNPRMSVVYSTDQLYAWKNDASGVGAWTATETLTSVFSTATNGVVQVDLDSSGNHYSALTDGTTIKLRNHTAGSTATIDNTSSSLCHGFQFDANDGNIYYNNHGSTTTEKYGYKDTDAATDRTVSNTTSSTVSNTYAPGDRPAHVNAYDVISTVAFGGDANSIRVRRMCFDSQYVSQEFSDSTLSAWGTYVSTGLVTAGNTVTEAVALNTISPPTSYNTITSGSLVSSDASKVYAKVKVKFVILAWGRPEIDTIVLNYTGTGVDPKDIVAVSYKNELYIAASEPGDDSNAVVLVLDQDGKLLKLDYPVASFGVLNNRLYAGKSSNGDLLKLVNGFSAATASYGMDFQSKEDFLEGIELEKDVYKYYVLYEVKTAGTFTFSYRLNNFMYPDGTDWTTQSVDMTADGVVEIPVGNKCRSIQFRITDSSSANAPVILGVVLVYGTLNIR